MIKSNIKDYMLGWFQNMEGGKNVKSAIKKASITQEKLEEKDGLLSGHNLKRNHQGIERTGFSFVKNVMYNLTSHGKNEEGVLHVVVFKWFWFFIH